VQRKLTYWCYPKHLIQDSKNDNWQRQKSVTLLIPKQNHFGLDLDKIPVAIMDIVDAFGAPVDNVLEQLEVLAGELASEAPDSSQDLLKKIGQAGALLWRLTRTSRRIQQGTVQQIKRERALSENLLWGLDYTPGSASLWGPAGGPYEFEFGAGTVRKVWADIDSAIQMFEQFD